MKIKKFKVLFILCFLMTPALSVSGFYSAYAAVGSFFSQFTQYMTTKWPFSESCSNTWIIRNTTGLQKVLNDKLYGQHLVLRAVVNHIKAHIFNKNPSKALVLSFHGGTGTGKNYVSKIIADHVYRNGLKSKHVHLISATKEFPHEEMIHFYKDQLRNWIESNVSSCSHSMFIFDEMDKMPAGLLDTLKPYLDYYEQLGGINYRHAIFLFLSNTAGSDIIKYTYEQKNNGVPRDKIKLVDIENIITKSAINTNTHSGLWHSELITKHLITAYLPFLPLTKSHVRRCVVDTLVDKGYFSENMRHSISDELINEIMEELTYFPEEEKVFSITGCKRVAEKVDFIMVN